MTNRVLPLSKHINKIFSLFTIIAILLATALVSLISYSKERDTIYKKMSHLTDMFMSLSDNFFKKYDDVIIPITKKTSLLDDRIIKLISDIKFIHHDDNYFILNKDLLVSSTTETYKNFINLSMEGFDIFKKKPVSDVYQSIFSNKSVVANIYDLTNGSMLIIERDLHNFIPIVEEFNKKYSSEDSFFFIISGNGEVVYHPDKTLMDTRHNLGFEIERYISRSSKNDLQVIYLDNNAYFSYIKDFESPRGWKAVFVFKYSTIINLIFNNVSLQVSLIFISLALLSLLIKRFIDKDVVRPLSEMSNFLAGIKSLDAVRETMPKDNYKVREFDTIRETFNKMIGNIKESYERLARNEEKFRLLSEFSPVWIYWIDQDERIVYMSSAVEIITGYKLADFEKDPSLMENIIHSSDRHIFEDHHDNIVKKGHDKPIEFRIIRKDGEIRWIRHLCRKIYNQKGEYLGIRGSNTDITTRKGYELEVLRQKEELYITLESIGDGVISTDKKGRVQHINKEAQRLTEWSKEEAIGRYLKEVFHIVHEDTLEPIESPVEIVIRENQIVTLSNHTMLISKSGKKISIADSAAPVIDNDGNLVGVVLVFRDVTEKKALEAESIRASKLDSLSVLAGGIAHDFNNILTAIIGNLSICKYFLEVDSKVYERLDIAERSAEKAKDLVTRLMTFAKGSMPVKKTIPVKELIAESVSFLLSGSKSSYELMIEDSIWNIYADEGQITQVLHNLLINADQAMPQGGKILITANNLIVTSDNKLPLSPGRYIKLCISDTGVGIPAEKLDKVFDPYFTTKPHGTGLGLASTYSIVKKHDGHITIKSQVGIGTTVCVYLPASINKIKQDKSEHVMFLNLNGRVLFMDDDPHVYEISKEFLNKAGLEVIYAKDGYEAIDLYREALNNNNPFKLVILDLTIPGSMGGKETIKRLYEIDPSVVAIVTSGYSEDIIMSNYEEYGFSGVLKKPFDFKQMIKEVTRLMSSS